MYETRVLSGMRPTGSLHLGHYHGVLKNWVRLQAEYLCLFFVADWHALTSDYAKAAAIAIVLLVIVALLVIPYLVQNARAERGR
jgi:tryptophanyl-tRNA synthetase